MFVLIVIYNLVCFADYFILRFINEKMFRACSV